MAGTLDAQGVYTYDETDKASPFSDLLNLGMSSVSDALLSDRDRITALEKIFDPWAAYTPALTGITIGNGTATGRYKQVGKTVMGRIRVVMGSTTTFTAATFLLGLPVASALAAEDIVGTCYLLDSSAGSSSRLGGVACLTTGGMFLVADHTAAGATTVTNLVPWTWASGDKINVAFAYEAA